jgi:hypothetical protein
MICSNNVIRGGCAGIVGGVLLDWLSCVCTCGALTGVEANVVVDATLLAFAATVIGMKMGVRAGCHLQFKLHCGYGAFELTRG